MRSTIQKLMWAALIPALTGTVAQAQTYSNAVMALNPAAYWPLNETNPAGGYIATNYGTLGAWGNGYYADPYPDDLGSPAASPFTGPVAGVTSDGDMAASFPGTGQLGSPTAYMVIPHASLGVDTPAPFTAEVWVEPQGGDPNDTTGSSYASTEWTSVLKEGYGGNGFGDQFDAGGDGAGWSIALAGIYSVGYPVGWYTPGPTELMTNATWIADFFSGNNGGAPSLEFDVPMYEPTPQWFHLVLVYDGTNASFYTNGVLAATTVPGVPQNSNTVWAPGAVNGTTTSGTYTFVPHNGVSYAPDNINPVVLGNITTSQDFYNDGYPNMVGGTIGFNNQNYLGSMDEVAIYSNALSSATVAKHFADATASDHTLYTNDVLSANPPIYLRLDEPAYTQPDPSTFPVANNYGSMGSAANGAYQPGTVPGVAGAPLSGLGPEDYAVAINGFDAGVDAGQQALGGSLLDPQGNVPFSLVYWFKANPADSYARFQTIIGRGDQGWRSSIDANGDLRWNPGAGPELISAKNYDDGAWHMFAGTTDGTNCYMYVDGILSVSGSGVGTLDGTTFDVMIGGAPDYTKDNLPTASDQRYFAGELSEAAFFTNALTDSQVVALFDAAGTPAGIATEPIAVIPIPVGQNGTISVAAVGTQPLTYQWYDDGTALNNNGTYNGVNSNILTITDAQLAQSGSYTVVVTNIYGVVTSTVATVVASQIPTILTNPAPSLTNLYAGAGTPVTYIVGAAGVAPFYYQWYNGSSPISGATATIFTTTATAGTNNYTVVVTNAYGSTTSSVVTIVGVTFVAPPTGFAVNYNDGGQAAGKAGAYQGMGVYVDAPANTNWNVWPSAPGGLTSDAVASSGAASLVSFSIDFGFNNGVNNAGYQGSPCYLVEYEAGINGNNPAAGTAANPMGTFTFNDVPMGVYTLYVYSANYDGNRGSIISLAADNGGFADGGTNATINVQSDHTCDTMVEGDNYVFFRGVVPDSNGQINGSYIPNPNGAMTGEGQIDALQLVLETASIQQATAGNVTLNWSGGSLQSAPSLTGPWTAVTGTSPLTIPTTGTNQFFRVY